jgi:hypothetical protein
MPSGLFRVHGVPCLVQVQFGPFSRPITEQEYKAAGYEPPLQQLPWQRNQEGSKSGLDADGGCVARPDTLRR